MRAFNAAIYIVREREPEKGETAEGYMKRVSAEVRDLRGLGLEADDESWFDGALDDAVALLTIHDR